MIDLLVRLTVRRPASVASICERLGVSERGLRKLAKGATTEGYAVRIVDGFVTTRVAMLLGPSITCGDARPGRKYLPAVSDIHFGSSHCDVDGLLSFLHHAWDRCAEYKIPEKHRVCPIPGDVLDGFKPVLIPDQDQVTLDRQGLRAVATFKKAPPFTFPVIGGNHDGYHDAACGFSSGAWLQDRMREAGVKWHFLGSCLGRANIHGASVMLWHPHGGASTRNALRRILNERIESMQELVHIVFMGHFHKFVPLLSFPERTLGVAMPTWQRKRSEFANRIARPWDVGGVETFYTVDRSGQVSELSADYRPARGSLAA